MRLNGLKSLAGTRSVRSSSRLGRLAEILLLLILAVQIARFFWTLVSPPGAFGDWRPFSPSIPGAQARAAIFGAFDPFYRGSPAAGGAVQQVTSLPFKLYGIRVNEASGRGTAIIADETGKQSSFAVGEEVAPGITLKGVAYDHVILSRNGADETLYIDQSSAAPPPAAPAAAGTGPDGRPLNVPSPASGAPPAAGAPLLPQALLNGVGFAPRMAGGAVTGVVVTPQAGDAFSRAGFRQGDIVAQVNGAPVRSTDDIVALKNALKPGARLSLMVERGGETVPIAIIIPDNK